MDLSNIKEMMDRAQQVQQQMDQAMSQVMVEGSAGAGAVTVQMNGRKQVLRVRIGPSAAESGNSPADMEMLQDLIVAACNDATRKVDDALQSRLSGAFGGMNLLNMLTK
jgi:DNA-binding YbaB/EbfC family protein